MGLVERRTIYGRNDFEKDRRGITYHTERAASCGTYDIETVVHGIKVVSAPAYPWSVCLSVIRKGGACYVQI